MKSKTRVKKRIQRWKLSQLKSHPKQELYYGDVSDIELKSLADNMHHNGQIDPVECTSDGTIIDGHQRVRAAQELGWTQVRVWVRNDLEEQGNDAVERRFLEANFHRRQLSKLAQARVYQGLREITHQDSEEEEEGDLRDFIAKSFGVSGRTLDRWKCVLETPVEVQHAVESGQLSMHEAGRVAKLSAEEQYQIADELRAGDEPKEVIARLAPPRPPSESTIRGHVRRVLNDLAKGLAQLAQLEEDAEENYERHDVVGRKLYQDDLDWLEAARDRFDSMICYIQEHPDDCGPRMSTAELIEVFVRDEV